MRRFHLSALALTLALTAAFYACQKNVSETAVPASPMKAPKQSTLDAPTIQCGTATGASIEITVTAGSNGAPAGFSVQWMTKAEYDLVGWSSEASTYCGASFSGVPGCSNYNLAAGESATVKIGDLFDECGVSGGCGDLVCGTEYVFRAFAHNDPQGLNKSGFSSTITCSTLPCGSEGCTLTQGFWKTHGPEGCVTGNNANAWPEEVMTNGLQIGNITYTPAQLCTILNTPPAGGTNYSLAHQLIAALLNQANGASVPAEVQNCINIARDYFTTHTVGDKNDGTENTDCLTNYNEGATGPGHCSSN